MEGLGLLQALFRCRYGHQVDGVGHEAVGEGIHLVLVSIGFEPTQVGLAIFIAEENVFPAVAPLGNMVSNVGADRTG